jgi:predicted phosphoribosyltransferase
MSRNTLTLGFRDRADAGQALGRTLLSYRSWDDPLVLAIPRGGVPVGYEVATVLSAPMDVLVVRKVGHPDQPSFSLGAVAGGGVRVMGVPLPDQVGDLAREDIETLVAREEAELARREALYRPEGMPLSVGGHEVILVDEGIATGTTMRAAVEAVRRLNPVRLTVAVPVGDAESTDALRALVDEVICVRTPEPFGTIGEWYQHFPQVSDDELRGLLQRAHRHVPS